MQPARDDELPTLALNQRTGSAPAPTTAPPPHSGPTAPAAPLGSEPWPVIPGYEVLAEVGRGGMGIVYQARHQGLNCLVALKVLRAGASTAVDAARFEREAHALARVRHPAIVAVHDAGTYCDPAGLVRPYLALEWVAGASLDQLLRRSALAPRVAAALVRDLARALTVVHEAGIIHRDIKPANVLLASGGREPPEVASGGREPPEVASGGRQPLEEGHRERARPASGGSRPPLAILVPKLTDFGLALLAEDQAIALTRGDQLLGTPGYLAPEQVQGGPRAAGPASDLHALGAVLYEALTGRPAFKAANLHEVLEQVVSREPLPVRQLSPDVPRDLETITLHCLHKVPEKRYPSAALLADDLDRFLAGKPIHARPVSPLRRAGSWARRHPALATLSACCAALGLALVATAAWYAGRLGRADSERRAARADAEAAREIAATGTYHALLTGARRRGEAREPGWRQAGLSDVQAAAQLETRNQSPAELRNLAAWCLLGTDVRPLATVPLAFRAWGVAFHPHRDVIAVAQFKSWVGAAVHLLSSRGEVLQRFSFPTYRLGKVNDWVQDGARGIAFSPDGRWLVVGTRSGWLHRWGLSAATPRIVSWRGHLAEVRDLCFCPLSHALFTIGAEGRLKRWAVEDGWKCTHDIRASGRLDTRAACGELLLADGDRAHWLRRTDLSATRPAFPADGTYARLTASAGPVVLTDGHRLELLDAATGARAGGLRMPGLETAHEAAIDHIAVSPDGAYLASIDEPTRHARIWELASGRLLANLTFPGGPCRAAWRPDSRGVAIQAGDRLLLYEVDAPAAVRSIGLHTWPVHTAAALSGKQWGCLSGDRPSQKGELVLWSLSGTVPECQQRLPVTLPEARLPLRLVADEAGRWLAWTEKGRLARARLHQLTQPTYLPSRDGWGLAFAPDGRLWHTAEKSVFAFEQGPAPALWTNTLSDRLTGLGSLWPVAGGPTGTVVGGRDGHLRQFSPKGELKSRWQLSRSELRCIAVDADGRRALVGAADGVVQLIALPTGEVLASAPGHREQVEGAAFLAEGLAATASADGLLRVWQTDGGRLTEWLAVPLPAPVKELKRDATGGRLLLVLAGERTARVLDLAALRDGLRQAGVE